MENMQKAILYVMGAAHDLKQKGLLEGSPGFEMTPKGIAIFDQLKASKYAPTDEELEDILDGINGSVPGLFKLFKLYRDGKIPL